MIDPLSKTKNGAKTLRTDDDIDFSKYKSSKPQLKVGDVLVFSGLTVHRSIAQKSNPIRVSTQFRLGNFNNTDAIKRGWPVGQLEGRSFDMDHPEYIAI